MGQYYIAVELDRSSKIIRAREISPYKLTEHSYFGNWLVNNVLKDIERNPMRIIWAGDYADPEPDVAMNYFQICSPGAILCEEDAHTDQRCHYLVNHTKKVYIDIDRYLNQYNTKKNALIFHPLPLLCAEGNQGCGGDYNGTYMNYVGTWSRDLVSMESDIPAGFEENRVFFKE